MEAFELYNLVRIIRKINELRRLETGLCYAVWLVGELTGVRLVGELTSTSGSAVLPDRQRFTPRLANVRCD